MEKLPPYECSDIEAPADSEDYYPVLTVQAPESSERYYLRRDPNYAQKLMAQTAILTAAGI